MIKKFFISVVAFAFLFFAFDRIGGWLMSICLDKTDAKAEVKMRYLVEDVSEPILLMGTSRCAYHYIPSIISDSLNAEVYNGGISASDNIYSHYILLNLILKHHKPNVVCLEMMTNDLLVQDDSFSKIAFFAPYFGRNAEADSVYMAAGRYWNYKIFHLYRYNSKAIEMLGGMLVNHRYGEDHGYFKILGTRDESITIKDEEPYEEVDSMKLHYFQKFIYQCHSNGIKLVCMVSPRYSKVVKDEYKPLKDIAESNGVPFLDYHSAGLYLDRPELFRDNGHMLEEGANAYSSIFASDLKRVIGQ